MHLEVVHVQSCYVHTFLEHLLDSIDILSAFAQSADDLRRPRLQILIHSEVPLLQGVHDLVLVQVVRGGQFPSQAAASATVVIIAIGNSSHHGNIKFKGSTLRSQLFNGPFVAEPLDSLEVAISQVGVGT